MSGGAERRFIRVNHITGAAIDISDGSYFIGDQPPESGFAPNRRSLQIEDPGRALEVNGIPHTAYDLGSRKLPPAAFRDNRRTSKKPVDSLDSSDMARKS